MGVISPVVGGWLVCLSEAFTPRVLSHQRKFVTQRPPLSMVLCRHADGQWIVLGEAEARGVLARAQRPVGWRYCHRPQWQQVTNLRPPNTFEHCHRARTHGLSRADYDQREGIVVGWDVLSARFIVKLDGAGLPSA